jgi:Tol biopolymer transport system component
MKHLSKSIQLLALWAGISLLAACSKQEPIAQVSAPEIKASTFKTYSAEEFFKTRSVFGSSINADASAVLVSDDESGIFNAYKVPLDGSAPIQLTYSTKESIYVEDWFPEDDRFLYSADKGGDELDHLFVQELDGTVKDLTPGDGLKAYFVSWHENKKQFYVATNERDAKFFDIYLYRVADYTRELIYQNDSGYSPEAISPNGQYIVLSKTNTNADSNLYLVNLASKQRLAELITDHEGDVDHSAYTFTRDNSALIYSTDEFGEFKQVWTYDLTSKEKIGMLGLVISLKMGITKSMALMLMRKLK